MNTESSVDVPVNIERRHFQRKKFRANIEIEWGCAILIGMVRDISPSGLFLELSPPLWVGARFLARIILNPVLPVDCVVRRVEPGNGMAISFEISEKSGKEQLETLLATLPQT